jgi:hypothetical protein
MVAYFAWHHKDFFQEEGAQDLVEYSLLLAFIALAANRITIQCRNLDQDDLDRHKHRIDKRCVVLEAGPKQDRQIA